MKQGRGNTILVYGSPELTRALLAHGLVDELRLWIAPVAVGGGARLFAESTGSSKLQLVNVKTFETGVVVLTYSPA
jgi:dihydrofolate reductase